MTDTSWIDEIEAYANAVIAGPWINQHYSLPEDGIGIIAANLGGLVAWATLFPTEIAAEDPCRAEAVADFIAKAKTDIPRLTAALRASLAREKAMREALEPFARMAASIDDGTEEKLRCLDDMEIERAIWGVDQATVGDCRRARAALEPQP